MGTTVVFVFFVAASVKAVQNAGGATQQKRTAMIYAGLAAAEPPSRPGPRQARIGLIIFATSGIGTTTSRDEADCPVILVSNMVNKGDYISGSQPIV